MTRFTFPSNRIRATGVSSVKWGSVTLRYRAIMIMLSLVSFQEGVARMNGAPKQGADKRLALGSRKQAVSGLLEGSAGRGAGRGERASPSEVRRRDRDLINSDLPLPPVLLCLDHRIPSSGARNQIPASPRRAEHSREYTSQSVAWLIFYNRQNAVNKSSHHWWLQAEPALQGVP